MFSQTRWTLPLAGYYDTGKTDDYVQRYYKFERSACHGQDVLNLGDHIVVALVPGARVVVLILVNLHSNLHYSGGRTSSSSLPAVNSFVSEMPG